jgi:hypothetical protein
MKKRLCLGVTLVSAVALISYAADKNREKLPSWVSNILAGQFADADIVSSEREGDDDDNRFEVELKRKADGRKVTVDLTEDVGVVEIDESVASDQLPAKVTRGLRKAFPNAEIRQAEKNTDIRVSYSIDIVSEGRKREVRISQRGKILEVEKRD